jgi:hypothetical protein
LTLAPHSDELDETVRGAVQVSVHDEVPETSVVVLAELLPGVASGALLEALAVFVITVPPGVDGFTCTSNIKLANSAAARFAAVHVIVPVPPTGGVVHTQPKGGTID